MNLNSKQNHTSAKSGDIGKTPILAASTPMDPGKALYTSILEAAAGSPLVIVILRGPRVAQSQPSGRGLSAPGAVAEVEWTAAEGVKPGRMRAADCRMETRLSGYLSYSWLAVTGLVADFLA